MFSFQTSADERVRAIESELETCRSIHDKESRNADERYNQLNDDFRKLMATVADKNHASSSTSDVTRVRVLD